MRASGLIFCRTASAATGAIRVTGFGVASRLPRERQDPGTPEVIAGTLSLAPSKCLLYAPGRVVLAPL